MSSTVSNSMLATCPFCGGEASSSGVVRYSEKHEAWFADGTRITEAYFCNCMRCGITNKGLLGHQTPEKAIEAWNRRAGQTKVVESAAMAARATPPAAWDVVRLRTELILAEGAIKRLQARLHSMLPPAQQGSYGSSPQFTAEAVEAAVAAVIEDLSDRAGLGQEWDQIDAEIQKEIRDAWGKVIRETLAASERSSPKAAHDA